MPPKAKVTKEMITSAALAIARREGLDALSVRRIAKELGCSTQPIFSNFKGIGELKAEVIRLADRYYTQFVENEVRNSQYPPYKASGIAYIHFAKNETELFRLLFMRDRSKETTEEKSLQDHEFKENAQTVRDNASVSEKTAVDIHAEMWVFVHGIATMIATSYQPWDDETISEMLTLAYRGVLSQMKEGNDDTNGD